MLRLKTFPLWCYTVQSIPWFGGRVKWELEVPDDQIAGFIRELPDWQRIVTSDGGNWDKVIIQPPIQPSDNISAVVRFPLTTKAIRCPTPCTR
jgi:hypothetical protein